MSTRIVYFDESGDDGLIKSSSDHFVLTSLYMPAESWQNNFDICRSGRKEIEKRHRLHATQEFHTKEFLFCKSPYCDYDWSDSERRSIIGEYTNLISRLSAASISVIIDKKKVHDENYDVLDKALTFNLQRIENDSRHGDQWNYIAITDTGRTAPMRKTARKIRAYNPIPSMFSFGSFNQPIKYMIEDILEKDSKESYFIQICDFISYFVHLYFISSIRKEKIPKRASFVVSEKSVNWVLEQLRAAGILNLNANSSNPFGIVIYPK